MKVILYMSMTVNGYIAKENNDTSFVSEVEWKNFRKIIKSVGNLIIGRKTYEVMKKEDEFSEIEKIKVFVVTHNKKIKENNKNIIFIDGSLKNVLNLVKDYGFNKALIAGGGKLNASLMKENLIDEIYLDIEPIILGKGIKLFFESDFENKLELLEIKKLDKNLIQLHYKILK